MPLERNGEYRYVWETIGKLPPVIKCKYSQAEREEATFKLCAVISEAIAHKEPVGYGLRGNLLFKLGQELRRWDDISPANNVSLRLLVEFVEKVPIILDYPERFRKSHKQFRRALVNKIANLPSRKASYRATIEQLCSPVIKPDWEKNP